MQDILTISLAPWFEAGHCATPELSRRIDEACVNTGFLLVSGHGLDQRLLNEAFHRASDLFDFMHPDYDAVIECIPSVLGRGDRPKYPSITAGEHIRTKIARSHGQR